MKKNLWPFGIIAAFVIFVAGTAALIVIAGLHRSDLVTPDYYEQEIRFQTEIDRAQRTRPFQSQIAVAYDAARQSIVISLPVAHARPETKGRIQLYRPSAAGQDRHVHLALDANGAQTLDARDLSPGLWKVRISWSVGTQEYFVDQKLVVGRSHANPVPANVSWL